MSNLIQTKAVVLRQKDNFNNSIENGDRTTDSKSKRRYIETKRQV